jgi:hypothetical protein
MTGKCQTRGSRPRHRHRELCKPSAVDPRCLVVARLHDSDRAPLRSVAESYLDLCLEILFPSPIINIIELPPEPLQGVSVSFTSCITRYPSCWNLSRCRTPRLP